MDFRDQCGGEAITFQFDKQYRHHNDFGVKQFVIIGGGNWQKTKNQPMGRDRLYPFLCPLSVLFNSKRIVETPNLDVSNLGV